MKSSFPSSATVFASSLILAFGSIIFVRLVYAPAEEARTKTVTTLLSSHNPAGTAHRVTLTASVHLHGVPVGAGTVRFYDETNRWLLGVADVSAPSIAISGLTPGVRAIRAHYSGVFRHAVNVARPSSSAPLMLDVRVSPNIGLTAFRDWGGQNGLVAVTALVNAQADRPGGSVTFKAGGRIIATQMLDGSGRAVFVTSALDEGSHLIAAEYHGDGAFAPASGTVYVSGVSHSARHALR